MDTLRDVLQQHAEGMTQIIRAAFPDVPLPADIPLGCGYWIHDEHGGLVYHFTGLTDSLEVEAFFRGLDWHDLSGTTPQQTRTLWTRFFQAPPQAKRWTEVVGAPLLSWDMVSWSLNFMSPLARAYYLPAYLLTALPILIAMRLADEDFPYVWGKVPSLEFVGHIINILTPPVGLDLWAALAHLPPEALTPPPKR